MHGGTVGDGRGGPGSSRVAVGGPSGRLPVLPGCAAPVGVGTAAWGARDRRGAAAAAGPLRAVPGHACAAAGDGVAAAGVRGRGDRRGAAGSGCGEGSPLDRGGAEGSGGDGAGLATGDGRATGPRSGASAAGGPPGRCRHRRAGALGCPWRDLLAALGAATAALTGRFGPVGVLGPVTAWQVAAACSAGRLLAPGWPAAAGRESATRVAPDVRGG
jgi:hypothetical protein